MKSHSSRLGETPVLKLIMQMSTPSVVSMMVIAAYNMVDAMFVGHFVGPDGLAALASNIPAVILMMGFSLFIGVGGSTAISRSLGMGKHEQANRIFGVMLFLVLVLGVVSVVLSISGVEWILRLVVFWADRVCHLGH